MSWFTKWSFANKAAITLISIIIIAWGRSATLICRWNFAPGR